MQSAIAATMAKFDAWLEGPASLVGEARRALGRRTRLTMTIAGDGGSVEIAKAGDGREPPVAILLDGGGEPDAGVRERIRALVRDCAVDVLVPENWIIERRIELPVEAASHVDGIVATRVAALSPIPPQDALFGHRILDVDRATGKMAVALAILPRARIARVLLLLEKSEAHDVGVKVPLSDGGGVTLTPRRSGGPGRAGGDTGRNVAARRALAGLLLLAVTAAAASLVARPVLDMSIAERRAGLERRAEAARETIRQAATPTTTATMPEEAALQLKNDAISALGALDDLAAALPLHAHATEIVLSDGRLRVTGRTPDLPDVLTALESSGRFAGSRLVGTAQLSPDGVSSDFVVETRPLIRTGGALR